MGVSAGTVNFGRFGKRTPPFRRALALRSIAAVGKKKLRVIDDFKASRANDLLELSETCAPDSLDVALAMMAMQAKLQLGEELQIFSLDFAHAYKHIGVASDQEEYAAVILGMSRACHTRRV